jgi:hypothetical protein
MKLLTIALVAAIFTNPCRMMAGEEVLSGHVEYHGPNNEFTVAAFNWGKLYYDANGAHKPSITLAKEQTGKITSLGFTFKNTFGQMKSEEIPDGYKGAVMIFSFKAPGAKETFTARVLENEKAAWKVLNELRIYLDGVAVAAKPTNAEPAGADQPATKPADKAPSKDQPSTPTPKGGPR